MKSAIKIKFNLKFDLHLPHVKMSLLSRNLSDWKWASSVWGKHPHINGWVAGENRVQEQTLSGEKTGFHRSDKQRSKPEIRQTAKRIRSEANKLRRRSNVQVGPSMNQKYWKAREEVKLDQCSEGAEKNKQIITHGFLGGPILNLLLFLQLQNYFSMCQSSAAKFDFWRNKASRGYKWARHQCCEMVHQFNKGGCLLHFILYESREWKWTVAIICPGCWKIFQRLKKWCYGTESAWR